MVPWRPAEQLLLAVLGEVGVEGLSVVLGLALLETLEVCELLLVVQTLLEGKGRHAVVLPVRQEVRGRVPHGVVQSFEGVLAGFGFAFLHLIQSRR